MKNPHILILEDEQQLASYLQGRLAAAGYTVNSIARSATDALRQASDQLPDLVLVDMQVGGDLDGIEIATELWENFHLPIIYITDETDAGSWQRAQATQPYGVLFKPLNEQDLLATLATAMNRHQAEQELREALRERQEQVELKSRLVSIVSHEFRNPLNTILFSAELLQRFGDEVSDEKRHTYFQRINGAVKRMNQLLDDVLMIGATESGRMRFHPLPIDLVAFCKEIIQEFQPYRGDIVEFMGEISVDPLVVVDEKLIRHILTNLISNAIKYSPQGTIVEFHLTLDAQKAVFRIQDQGIGITAADQENLFTSFFRGSNARRIPGTGLGLSIVKQCVEMHGGRIALHSEPGHGSTFTVTIPLQSAMRLGNPLGYNDQGHYDDHSGD
jgi:signal transduction histidine kinase